MLNKFPNPLKVVLSISLDIVMACELYEIGFEAFIDRVFPEAVAVTYVYNFVSLAMDYVNWAIKVLDPIDIWKLIKPQSPSKIRKDYPKCTHKWCMQHYPGHMVFLRQEA